MPPSRTTFLGEVRSRVGAAVAERLRRRWLARAHSGRAVSEEVAVTLALPGAAPVPAHLHRPPGPGRRPGVVLVPGALRAGSAFDGFHEVVSAEEIAALGVVTLHYDPAGRGASTGFEDFGGPVQQAELAAAIVRLLDDPGVDPTRVGVLSVSLGLAAAAGALAGPARVLPVAFLLDWEGPADAEDITRRGASPWAMAYRDRGDREFWDVREPIRLLPGLRCGYRRYQGRRDHALGAARGHAWKALAAARGGTAAWTQLNDEPRDRDPEDLAAVRWAPSGAWGANRGLLAMLARQCGVAAPDWPGW